MSVISMGRAVRLLFGAIDTGDHRRRRLLGLVQGVVTGLGSRVVGMLVSFLSVPLTIGYLGTEQYGAWVTLGSLLAWLQLADLGLGNGLTNAVTTAAGQDRPDLVRMHLSNAVLMLGGVAAVVGLMLAVAWPFIDWGALFGLTAPAARTEMGWAVATAMAIFLLQFPLAVTGKVYLAYQEGRIGSYWGISGNLLSLLALVAVTHTQGGLVLLVLAVSGTGLLVNVGSSAWLFLRHRPSLAPGFGCVNFGEMRNVGFAGSKFFLIQIMALVTFQTDNLIIGYYLGASQVPPYSLTYSLFSYTSLPQSILFQYLWVAYGEAIARKDISWVKRTYRLNIVLGLIATGIGVACLAFIAKPFIAIWASAEVVPSSSLIAWIAAWSMINAYTNPMACLLAAASHLRNQIIYSGIATASNIGLSIYLVQLWGAEGVIAATVISYFVFVCLPVTVDVENLIRRLKNAM